MTSHTISKGCHCCCDVFLHTWKTDSGKQNRARLIELLFADRPGGYINILFTLGLNTIVDHGTVSSLY